MKVNYVVSKRRTSAHGQGGGRYARSGVHRHRQDPILRQSHTRNTIEHEHECAVFAGLLQAERASACFNLMRSVGSKMTTDDDEVPDDFTTSCLGLLPLFAAETLAASCQAAGVPYRRVLARLSR